MMWVTRGRAVQEQAVARRLFVDEGDMEDCACGTNRKRLLFAREQKGMGGSWGLRRNDAGGPLFRKPISKLKSAL